ncbi:hypothetical protein OJF2_29560 [Aquisphaera giovannonii]|uniref:Uncharacterized protein n=1 Tax=Aquisphaera giovannonii TaxID=406548 RepID=A0A5B9W2H8_9BACT|nr:hypothetical protein [Aquisphaera giovannonii]QEH34417.1 hypothetical protein OJF2_29560 [Aquisphaera giovannonii]
MTPPENGTLNGQAAEPAGPHAEFEEHAPAPAAPPAAPSPELRQFLAEIKGQAQFLLYLADQIEESLNQLGGESDRCHGAFLCKVLTMYSGQLETKHQGLGEKIAEACQEVYITVREHGHDFDMDRGDRD